MTPNPQMLAALLGGGAKGAGNPILTVGAQNPQLLAAALQEHQAQQALQGVNEAGPQSKNAVALGLNLAAKAALDRKATALATQLGQAQMAQNQALAQALRPGNKAVATLLARDPQGTMEAIEKAEIAPTDVRAGNTLVNAPSSIAGAMGSAPGTFTAPQLQADGPTTGYVGMNGFQATGQRPMSYADQVAAQNAATQQAAQQETAAQNLRSNALQQQGLGIQAQQAQASMAQAAAAQRQAATGAGNLGLQQQTSPTFALPQGYVLNGAHP